MPLHEKDVVRVTDQLGDRPAHTSASTVLTTLLGTVTSAPQLHKWLP
jgi:hypothetical protein